MNIVVWDEVRRNARNGHATRGHATSSTLRTFMPHRAFKAKALAAAVIQAAALCALSGCGGGDGTDSTRNAAANGNESLRQASAVANAAAAAPNVVVRASGGLAGDVGPVLSLRVNGTVVASAEVLSSGFQDYPFTVPVIAVGDKVDVVFNNDGRVGNEDRNLFVESITINGTTIASNASGVTFDRGAGEQAFDGQDVLPGLSTLWWNGALRFTAPTGATASNLVVRAGGSLAGNVGPIMQVRVDGTVVASTELRSSGFQNYPFALPSIAPGAKLDVVFNNDGGVGTQDRNLFVESITVNGTTIASNAAGVTFDRGANDQAFDGVDVLPGLSTLWWNGALRFTAPAIGSTAGLSPACAAYYAAHPEFAPNDSQASQPQPANPAPLAKPARGVAVAEPAYKTCLVRASDHAADGLQGFAWNGYARRQAFNADGSKYLAYQIDGYWNVYDAKTHRLLQKLPGWTSAVPGLSGDNAEPQWSPTDPNLLNYFPQNGVGMQLWEMDITKPSQPKLVVDWSARLKATWPNASAAWTRGEGSPSKDGRYWCLLIDDNQFQGGGIAVWDRQTDTLAKLDLRGTASTRPDHVSMSPSGNYCVVSHESRSVGTLAYANTLQGTPRKILNGSQHSDIALDTNGDDVYVTAAFSDSVGTDGDVSMTNLRTGERTVLFNSYGGIGYTNGIHISGKSFNKPGWVLVSTYGGGIRSDLPQDKPFPWFHGKLFAMELKANPKIYNLAQNRATSGQEKLYWAEPSASVNRDFTKVYFNSNWGTGIDTGGDVYTVEIPAGLFKPGNGAPTTPQPPTQPGEPTTPPSTNPPANTLAVTLGSVTRSQYTGSLSVTTNNQAQCRLSTTQGVGFGALYDNLVTSGGLTHTKAVGFGQPTGAATMYVVCRDEAASEKELTVTFP
jgi:hypothetical protein